MNHDQLQCLLAIMALVTVIVGYFMPYVLILLPFEFAIICSFVYNEYIVENTMVDV